jgi:hypothetical protein
MPQANETRKCPHKNHEGNQCKGNQTYTIGRAVSYAGSETAHGDTTNMRRRNGWLCSVEEYPDHFDEA